MNETIQPTLALSDTFFDSFGRAPRPLQKKLLAFISKFKQNPSSSRLNYEKIQDSASPGYRSARLDNDTRDHQPAQQRWHLRSSGRASTTRPTNGPRPTPAGSTRPQAACSSMKCRSSQPHKNLQPQSRGFSEPAGAVPGAQEESPLRSPFRPVL